MARDERRTRGDGLAAGAGRDCRGAAGARRRVAHRVHPRDAQRPCHLHAAKELEASGVTLLTLDFNDAQFPEEAQAQSAAAATRDALAGHGVHAASMASALPVLGSEMPAPFAIDGASSAAGEAPPTAIVTGVTEAWPSVVGLRLRTGAWWKVGEDHVAVVSVAAADRYLGGVASALGRRLTLSHGAGPLTVRVVGVSADVVGGDMARQAPARVWIPLEPSTRRITYVLKADADADGLTADIRSVVATTAPAVPIENLRRLDEALAQAASSDYVVIGMLGMFAGVALILAASGLFGVVSFGTAQRTAEFGTRMALGASAWSVAMLVVRQSGVLLAIGLTMGLAAGVGLGNAMGGILNGVSPVDPVTLVGVTLLLVVVTWPPRCSRRSAPPTSIRQPPSGRNKKSPRRNRRRGPGSWQ